jgi:hypothetical protein
LEPGFSSAVQDSSRKCDPEFFDAAGESVESASDVFR